MIKIISSLLLAFYGVYSISYAQEIKRENVPAQPFYKYTKVNQKDTTIFYLSESRSKLPLPLVVYVQGSGNNSLFISDNGRILPQSGHITFFDIAKGRYRVLIIEKPGVSYLQNDIDNAKFDKRFSLESWIGLVVNTINTTLKTENIDKSKILIVGHSEGGLVAAGAAAKLNKIVSHVSIMAGEGTSQLYSLYRFAEEGVFFSNGTSTIEQRVDSLRKVWTDILLYPQSTSKKFWGFTYLRWSSFLQTSVLEQLVRYDGNVFIVQGTNDQNVYPESAKILYTSLLSKGKKARLEMVKDADHSFNITTDSNINGWQMNVEKIINWFLM